MQNWRVCNTSAIGRGYGVFTSLQAAIKRAQQVSNGLPIRVNHKDKIVEFYGSIYL